MKDQNAAIQIKDLKKYFGSTKAVDGITFDVAKGEIFGFLGPNGAGKTTTIRCMMDFIRPTSGSIKILGKDAQTEGVNLKHKVGYLSGQVHLYDRWTGQDHINFFKSLDGNKNIAAKLAERLDFNPSLRAKKLSSGNRQKLGLILAFMGEPDVLIFDEPTNALDPLLQNTVYELLEEARDRGATVFMSSHNLAEVERVCTRVGIIKKGKMVAVENITALHRKRLYTAQVFFENKVDAKEIVTNDIEVSKELPNGYVLSVKGDINILLDKLEPLPLDDIQVTHASLEDIFLEFYQ